MTTAQRVWCLGLVGLLTLMFANELEASGPGSRPIQLTNNLETVIPKPLLPLLLDEPFVRFMVTVNADGKLVDYLALEATHFELLERAEEVLQNEAVFTAGLDQGKPVQASGEVTVRFFDPEQRALKTGVLSRPYGHDASEAVYRRIYANSKERFAYRMATAAELPQPVTLREAKIRVLADAADRPASGECLLEYFIDRRGEVRMPRVVSSDNDTVALSALLTLKQTRYNSIFRKDGTPAYVKVRQPMSFAPPVEALPSELPAPPK